MGVLGSAVGLFGLSLLLRYWDPLPLKFPTDARKPFRVEVLNGCGRKGVAAQVAERLRRGGVDVVYVGNAGSFDHLRTLVVDRMGCDECAQAVADELGVRTVTVEIDSLRLVEVTVVVGHDLGTSEGT